MVSVKAKEIKGKKYLYAEYSFRLPDGKIKKISKLIKKKTDIKKQEVKKYFMKKEINAFCKYGLSIYKKGKIFTKEEIEKMEAIRVEYKNLFKKLTKKQLSDILDRFTMNFTYESNAIEGNSLTLKEVTLVLKENMVLKDKNLREIYETKNTRKANELLFNNKIKINIKDIIKLHSVLVKDTDVPSGFKKVPNYLDMRNVRTTSPENVEKEMKKLIEWYDKVKGKEHPIKIAADFHGKFERIHPFEDGNGRAGRILINAILLDNNYPPLIIRKTMRISYFSALESHDNGYKTKLERFLLDKFKRTFKEFFKIYVKYI